MTIDLVFITYNRLHYTKLALASVLADPTEEFSLTIWDNASTDGTIEYLKNEVNDRRIADIIFSKENIGQTAVVNTIWGNSNSDLLGKLDNDCLLTPGWTRTLAQAHEDIPNLGVVACWHFFPEDFDYERAKHKIQQFGKHQIFRHPWTCGSGLLIKRSTFKKLGQIQNKATTQYWLQMALKGYINGFYYPLIYQEHMDGWKSRYSRLNFMPFDQAFKYNPAYQTGRIKDFEQYHRTYKEILENLFTGPYEPEYYVGWRAKLRQVKYRINKLIKKVP